MPRWENPAVFVFGLIFWSMCITLGLVELVFTDRMAARNQRKRQETFDRYGEEHRGWRAILFFLPGSRRGVRWHGLFLVLIGLYFLLATVSWYGPG
jgi:hypothetical protein